jgi:hypothetical protein
LNPDALFDSAWAKWAQGVKHFQALQDDIAAFRAEHARGPVLATRARYDAKRHGFVIAVDKIEAIPMGWSLILGDAANNFRAALDHLAWALVSRGHTPPGSGKLTTRQESAVYFPLSQDRREFDADIQRPSGPKARLKLPGIRRVDSAKVRRHQPYHHGPRERPILALMTLASINAGDKHRTIQPIWIEPAVIGLHVEESRDCEIRELRTNRWHKRPLEVGTELALVPARKDGPDPQVQMKVNVAAELSVGKRITSEEWGARTAAVVGTILGDFSEPRQEIVEPLANLRRLSATIQALEARER